ncbi:MAG TPA: hypothetical protein VE861_04460 [Gemmatimonadaceae bacterium]|nr:hypothetical protein [Gemmatimonadaceae bacterium]
MATLILGAHGPIGLACTRRVLAAGGRVFAGVQAPHRIPPALHDLRDEYPTLLTAFGWADDSWPEIPGCERALVAELPIPPAQPDEGNDPYEDIRALSADVTLAETKRVLAPTLAAIRFVTAVTPKRVLLQASWLGVVEEKVRGGGFAIGVAYAAHLMLVRTAALDLHRSGITTVVANAGRYKLDMAGPAFHADIDDVAAGLLSVLDAASADGEPEFRDWRGTVRRW